jgi:hypothetical protein
MQRVLFEHAVLGLTHLIVDDAKAGDQPSASLASLRPHMKSLDQRGSRRVGRAFSIFANEKPRLRQYRNFLLAHANRRLHNGHVAPMQFNIHRIHRLFLLTERVIEQFVRAEGIRYSGISDHWRQPTQELILVLRDARRFREQVQR